MKTRHIITLLLAFVVSFSANAQGEKKSFRIDRNYGIGINPVFNISSSGESGSSNTRELQLGAMATATLNLRRNLAAIFGIGFLSDAFRSSFGGVTSYGANRNSLVFQLGAFATLYVLEISQKSQLDFALGLFGVYRNGTETITNDFGPDTEIDVNSILISPAGRVEWFLTPHLTIHTQVGIGISLLNESVNGFSNTTVNFKALQTSDLLGQSGFTFYF